MIRAGVFIGVNKTGGLRQLRDAAAGAERMYNWARSQGMTEERTRLLTDAGGKTVTARDIKNAVKAVAGEGGVDQLIVYFAGHGVNLNRHETWLLSEAPDDPNEAIDVYGSVDLARYSGIRYVALFSDACRVAADTIQAQNVRGQDVFRNEAATDESGPVDQFFGCLLGRPALEARDPQRAADGYKAIYTGLLERALKGNVGEVLEDGDAANPGYFVKPVPLQSYLKTEVPRAVASLGLAESYSQNPDAIITAHDHWLSRVEGRPTSRALNLRFANAAPAEPPAAEAVDPMAAYIAQAYGPDHFETHCGIIVRGAQLVSFAMREAQPQMLGTEGGLLRIPPMNQPASVVLEFAGGFGTVIPALPGYLATLTFADGELADVSFEPSSNEPLWEEYRHRAGEIRRLRGLAAAASHHGRFQLEPEVAQAMQFGKSLDPTLALYAAYAYHDQQETGRIAQMGEWLRDSLRGASLFDVMLLARKLKAAPVNEQASFVPFVPMLSQGWSLVRAHGVKLPAELDGIDRHLLDSVWSLYDAAGVRQLKAALLGGKVR